MGKPSRDGVRWFYATGGSPAFFQVSEHVFRVGCVCEYYQSGHWWHSVQSGTPMYYASGRWMLNPFGLPCYYTHEPYLDTVVRLGLDNRTL
jgi:hypothetical protein